MTVEGIDLHTLKPGDDGLRRDRWGRLLVVPPGATKAEGYTRVTTVAKALDEGGGLAPWKAAMAMTGLARRPGIAARWEALLAAHHDPWYSGPEVKAKVKELVEEAATAGGATDRRDQGEALHAITAQVDGGTVPHLLSVETQRDITAYLDTLARYGIEVVPGAIETTVVLDTYKVGGTFDRLVRVRGHDLPVVADLKTGADIKYSDGAFAVQLAAYAHMEALYTQGPTPAQDLREAPPEVDQHLGLIFWVPAGEGRCEVLSVDLDAGWEGFAASLSARVWRRRRDLMGPFSSWVAELVPPAPTPVDAPPVAINVEAPAVDPPPPVVVATATSKGGRLDCGCTARAGDPIVKVDTGDRGGQTSRGNGLGAWYCPAHAAGLDSPPEYEPDMDAAADVRQEVRRWLQERIDVVGSLRPGPRADLGRSWPPGMPTLRSSTEHTDADLAAIERVLDDIEARHAIPFGPTKPGHDPAALVLATFPGSSVTTKPRSI